MAFDVFGIDLGCFDLDPPMTFLLCCGSSTSQLKFSRWIKGEVIGYAAVLSTCLRTDVKQELLYSSSLEPTFPDLWLVTETFPKMKPSNICILEFDHL